MFKFLRYEQKAKVIMIPLWEIAPNPRQPRRQINPDELKQLSQSIKENGLICPITVRRTEEGFELITGQRRLAAFKELGIEKIPAIVEELTDDEASYHALVENLQRSSLSFLDESLAIFDILKLQRITQAELAETLGMSQSSVANKLRLLKLPAEILQQLAEAGFTERHARALLPLWDQDILPKLVDTIIEKNLNVRQTEELVNRYLSPKQKKPTPIIKLRDVRIFNTTLKKAVALMQTAGIQAVSQKAEDENDIIYTIRIPKRYDVKEPPRVIAINHQGT